eukprot:TRINITY_DN18303_c0_g1_i1.p2 TRINITY_DN18303_c0_g1~~TRINITY_DN18303_c0_g1_i1.p2  ORF type:complete len:129 (+),score=43.83 TRINITY_DN18303_c0_g1_i1:154-540(+)
MCIRDRGMAVLLAGYGVHWLCVSPKVVVVVLAEIVPTHQMLLRTHKGKSAMFGSAILREHLGQLDRRNPDQSPTPLFSGWVDTVLATRHPPGSVNAVSYTHLRAHETPEHLVCRLLLEKKKKNNKYKT